MPLQLGTSTCAADVFPTVANAGSCSPIERKSFSKPINIYNKYAHHTVFPLPAERQQLFTVKHTDWEASTSAAELSNGHVSWCVCKQIKSQKTHASWYHVWSNPQSGDILCRWKSFFWFFWFCKPFGLPWNSMLSMSMLRYHRLLTLTCCMLQLC